MKKKARKFRLKLKNALNNSAFENYLTKIDEWELSKAKYEIKMLLFYWIGTPTKDQIVRIKEEYPYLSIFMDFNEVFTRFSFIAKFTNTGYGVEIREFLPELVEVYEKLVERFHRLASGVKKAEFWLYPLAKNAGADADVEAAIYFASRGKKDIVDGDSLKSAWHEAICIDIEKGYSKGMPPPADIVKKARSRTISLFEAAEILKTNRELPRFFGFRNEEEDFIDSSFFRATEWFNITGFEPWLNSFAENVSQDPSRGSQNVAFGWALFYWCRSNIALEKIEKIALDSMLWSLLNNPIDIDRPWRHYWYLGEGQLIDYTPLAGIIPFAWHRIQPKGYNKEKIVKNAVDYLLQNQMENGGWRLKSDDSKADLTATCFAVHGLALAKPQGWQKATQKAAKWLLDQQDESGYWNVDGGPPVMLTVLVLDSLNLARDSEEITFNSSNAGKLKKKRISSKKEEQVLVPHYVFETEDWYNPQLPSFLLKNKSDAKSVRPKLSLLVATGIELAQTLRILKPLSGQRKIWNVTVGTDVYYVGRFGKYNTVVTQCSTGSGGPGGSTATALDLIDFWKPKAVILVGIAFGSNIKRHLVADVLISDSVIPYESQRVGENEVVFRGGTPPANLSLINKFRVPGWKFLRPDGTKVNSHIGAIFSGEKVVDNLKFKKGLLDRYPSAIGGEMEGAGLWAVANRREKKWIIVKGVCDWGEGKTDDFQEMAAASALSLCAYVFNSPYALDGI